MPSFEMITEHIGRLKVPFEDVYTTVFLIKTSEGAVLFDTATYPTDADNYIIPALEGAGVGVDGLKYIVISHAHCDHAGGLGRLLEVYPGACVVSESGRLREQFPTANWLSPDDGTSICGTLCVITMPGHSRDSIGVLDTRTKSLVSGDSLQLYGIFGSGKWGANITLQAKHLEVLEKLRKADIEHIFAAHDYHSLGWRADGREAVLEYYAQCEQAIFDIRDFLGAYQQMTDSIIAEMYNSTSGKPTVAERVFKAARELL